METIRPTSQYELKQKSEQFYIQIMKMVIYGFLHIGKHKKTIFLGQSPTILFKFLVGNTSGLEVKRAKGAIV